MSHLTLRRSESPPDSHSHFHSHSHLEQQMPTYANQDSPTIGRAALDFTISSSLDANPLPSLSLSNPPLTSLRSLRKPTPSPLQTSTAVSPPSSASPYRPSFPSPVHDASFPSAVHTTTHQQYPRNHHLPLSPSPDETPKGFGFAGRSFFRDDISPPATPVSTHPPGSSHAPVAPNDSPGSSQPAALTKPPVGSATANLQKMAGVSSNTKAAVGTGAPRTASLDSSASASSSLVQGSRDGPADIAHLVRTAGSPEAVIQYLLKEKQSQSQQNSQLWRLVDKQRAMILGLNKDLEKALKDKEKYRKKLKEVMAAQDDQSRRDTMRPVPPALPQVDVQLAKGQEGGSPVSLSNLDSDSIKNSPVDVALAPYPITPPADHIPPALPSAVGELLDPSHAMPKPSEHALDHFDHEQEDRAAEEARKATEASRDIPINLSLPPSRSLPSEPPKVPPPKPPSAHPPSVSVIEATPLIDQGGAQFPPPTAPPPRKPPPAPLQLHKESKMSLPPEDDDSESDYDSLLEVDELPIPEKRGRRRTREEDDREREEIAQKEAEARSLSKKSKKGSQKGTPVAKEAGISYNDAPASPRLVSAQPMLARENIPASLAGVLSGSEQPQVALAPPLMSPGLPSSPRPTAMKSPFTSPPLSPRGIAASAVPLSPRAPRQPIPLPPNTSLSTPSPAADALKLTSPKPLSIPSHSPGPSQPSPAESHDRHPERTKIYKGLVSDEYPDLLLPPNALPSVEVRVASSRMKPSRASLMSLTQLEEDPVFTLAIHSRSERGELWRVEKDTASFGKLDQMMKQCAAFTAKTPDRSLFSGHAPAKLDARRVVLDQYLDELLNTPLDTPTALELCRYLSTNTLRPNVEDNSPVSDAGSDKSPQKTGPGGRPFKNGYLTKRGKNFGGWKARYFVLDGPHLKYYETPGGAHLGTIKLQNAQIGKQSQPQQPNDDSPARGPNDDELDNQYRHAFLVLEPKKKDSSSHVKHVLCAESDTERDQWVEALLRWIDYRDPEEADSQSKERHAADKGSHVNGMNAKKKMYGQNKNQEHRSNSQDGLIGMSYASTKQGDLPEGVPTRRGGITSPDPHDNKMAAPKHAISAPRDPQLISDSATWGGKSSLVPPGPTLEEKKQRKRSFFGFGPKTTRSSSEDQDLYGGNGNQGEIRGPIRQVFGAPLADAVRFNGPNGVNVPLPAVVYRSIQYLDAKRAILEEGIFRLSGSNVVIKQLRERFNTEGDVNLITDETYYDIHAVASLLKLYLRELPTTILTRDLHMQFVAVTEMSNHREKIMALSELVQRLPLANETLLKYLIAFLIKIINNADINKMTVRNVGIVFSPTLNIPAPVFALLLQNYEGVFGIDPEEYELPSPSDGDARPPAEQPRRPSTAGTASPHRQRLMEQAQQRSTPTPPPMMNSGMRSTATPPPRQAYEQQYIAQHSNGSHTSLRPAYEGGFAAPQGYDPNSMFAPGVKQQPTYDQPHYGSFGQDYGEGSAPSYEQPFNARAKRRESSMFMGNMMLNQQGSKSRLREETRM
ncbi:RhoGAP domain-containing protein [Xylariomycetidae sp. FL2044]|nr:RhoGAP domain-containing protein [Xylariomycetidae sp. FL2044]